MASTYRTWGCSILGRLLGGNLKNGLGRIEEGGSCSRRGGEGDREDKVRWLLGKRKCEEWVKKEERGGGGGV